MSRYDHIGSQAEQASTEFVMKFSCPTHVTNIGIVGKQPVTRIYSRKSRKKRGKMTAYGGHIYILQENTAAEQFVKTFDLYYKDYATKKWIHVGRHEGTSSSCTESIIDLAQYFTTEKGIFTDSMKVSVKSYEGQPAMRIAVYGNSDTRDLEESIEAVTYILSKESNVPYVSDRGGISSKCNCYFCQTKSSKKMHRKGKNRRHMNMDIADQIDSADMSGEFCAEFLE
jgi:hypothetical protein